MPRRSTPPERPSLPDGDPSSVLRRAPFSANPRVGVRGQRAQQRILDAALQVFGEDGYHESGIARITDLAGCSRAAFYQYFSDKEDVFRHLAGQVARQLTASCEALDPISPDGAGWRSVRDWAERYGDIFDRYEPVFRAFQAASESDEAVASGARRIADRNVAIIRSKLASRFVPTRHVDSVIALLMESMSRTHRLVDVLHTSAPAATVPRTRVDDALADITHRTLCGFDATVNAHKPARRPPSRPTIRAPLASDRRGGEGDGLGPTGARTLNALLDAGHDVLVTRGYHGTRVDDITSAAGLSHGSFYRYFDNKPQMVRALALRAMQKLSEAFFEIPDIAAHPGRASSAALRQWLRRYNTAHARETAMIRVWVDASSDEPNLLAESAAALEWGRRRMVRFLQPRGFGDVDTEALALVALVDAFGAHRRASTTVDAAAQVIERGFLGVRAHR